MTLLVKHGLSRKAESQQASSPRGLDDIPGLNEGETVSLPQLPSLRGEAVSLSGTSSDYLLCAFISTECAGCAQDTKFWKNLHEEAAKRGVSFYLISLDRDRSQVEKFAKAYEFDDLNILYDPDLQTIREFKISFVPQYVLLMKSGEVVRRWSGLRRPEVTGKNDSLSQYFVSKSNP